MRHHYQYSLILFNDQLWKLSCRHVEEDPQSIRISLMSKCEHSTSLYILFYCLEWYEAVVSLTSYRFA